jgi:hypothetical protein
MNALSATRTVNASNVKPASSFRMMTIIKDANLARARATLVGERMIVVQAASGILSFMMGHAWNAVHQESSISTPKNDVKILLAHNAFITSLFRVAYCVRTPLIWSMVYVSVIAPLDITLIPSGLAEFVLKIGFQMSVYHVQTDSIGAQPLVSAKSVFHPVRIATLMSQKSAFHVKILSTSIHKQRNAVILVRVNFMRISKPVYASPA